jgi:hypothetical protein
MIRIVLAGLIAAFCVSPSLADPQALVHQAQFRGGPGGQCPDGYDFNYSNGRCYANNYRAPGAYQRGYDGDDYGYRRRRAGSCPHGYDFNYSNGRCYPNGMGAPGRYGR